MFAYLISMNQKMVLALPALLIQLMIRSLKFVFVILVISKILDYVLVPVIIMNNL